MLKSLRESDFQFRQTQLEHTTTPNLRINPLNADGTVKIIPLSRSKSLINNSCKSSVKNKFLILYGSSFLSKDHLTIPPAETELCVQGGRATVHRLHQRLKHAELSLHMADQLPSTLSPSSSPATLQLTNVSCYPRSCSIHA